MNNCRYHQVTGIISMYLNFSCVGFPLRFKILGAYLLVHDQCDLKQGDLTLSMCHPNNVYENYLSPLASKPMKQVTVSHVLDNKEKRFGRGPTAEEA